MAFPTMKSGSGTVYGLYRLGRYTGMLIRDPKAVGPIEYLYMLVVTEEGSKSTVLAVTCERNLMQNELLSAVADQLDEAARNELSKAPQAVLGLFDQNGAHHILQLLNTSLDEDEFRAKALAIAAEQLHVSEAPIPIRPEHRVSPSERDGFSILDRRWVVGAAIAALVFILLFPPVEQHYMSLRGAEISGHGGWKFIADIGKYNDRNETESINLALWLLEFGVVGAAVWIVSFFIGKK